MSKVISESKEFARQLEQIRQFQQYLRAFISGGQRPLAMYHFKMRCKDFLKASGGNIEDDSVAFLLNAGNILFGRDQVARIVSDCLGELFDESFSEGAV